MTTGSVAPAAADAPGCADDRGIWTVPQGLIVGGARDNTARSPYREWLAACGLVLEQGRRVLYVPLDEAVAEFETCLARGLAGLAEAGKPVVPGDPVEDPSGGILVPDGEESGCGLPPDPRSVLPNGTFAVEAPYLHVGSSHGSVWATTHQYNSLGAKKSRLNLFFTGNGEGVFVKNQLRGPSHWGNTGCGWDRKVYVWDEPHGGEDRWWGQMMLKAHHGTYCHQERYHIRLYGAGLRDTHSPGFGWYSFGQVHWDDLHHDNPDPRKGLNHLHPEMAALGWTDVWHWCLAGAEACDGDGIGDSDPDEEPEDFIHYIQVP